MVATNGDTRDVLHGAVIVATGARETETDEYLLGRHPAVVTQTTLETMLAAGDPALVPRFPGAVVEDLTDPERHLPRVRAEVAPGGAARWPVRAVHDGSRGPPPTSRLDVRAADVLRDQPGRLKGSSITLGS